MSKPVTIVYPATSKTSVAALQTTPNGAFTLNQLPKSAVQLAFPGQSTQISFTSVGDASALNIGIVGIDSQGNAISETLVGPNAGTVTSVKYYQTLYYIDGDDVTSGTPIYVKFNSGALPAYKFEGYQRTLTASSSVSQTGTFFTFIGIDLLGNVILETIAGADAAGTATTTSQFASVIMASSKIPAGSVSLGEGVGGAMIPFRLDNYRPVLTSWSVQCVISGSITYKINGTLDPLEYTVAGQGQVVNQNVNWGYAALASSTASAFAYPNNNFECSALQLVVTANTGAVTATFIQPGLVA